MVEFARSVAIPQGASFTPPQIDVSGLANTLANLPADYYKGQEMSRESAIKNAFSGGVPTDANGTPDYGAMAQTLLKLGDIGDASSLIQTGQTQALAKTAIGALNQPMVPGGAQPQAALTPPTQGAPKDYYGATIQHESGGNPTAGDPDHAYGLVGFMPDTWQHVVINHPELGLPADITKATPEQQVAATRALTQENAGFLAQNGIPVTDRSVYMAHFLGGAGAVKFFGALAQNGGAPAAALFPAEAAANPSIFYNKGPDGQSTPATLAQVFQKQTAQFGNGNTTGFNFQPLPKNQVAGPGAPSQIAPNAKIAPNLAPSGYGGPVASAASGEPVATDAHGNAIDPRTGQPTLAPRAPPVAAGPYKDPAANAFAQQLAAKAAAAGGTVPGGAASPGSAAGANAAAAAAGQTATPGANFGAPPVPLAPAPAAPAAPTRGGAKQVAQGDSEAPLSYAENLSRPPQSAQPQVPPPPAPLAGNASAPRIPPAPQSAPAPAAGGGPATGGLLDPSMGGIVPKQWLAAGGDAGSYANELHRRASLLSLSPLTAKAAEAYEKQADAVEQALRMANTPQPATKEYEVGRNPGESLVDFQARKAATIATAEQQAKNDNTLEKTNPKPGGPTQYDTAGNILRTIKAVNNGTAGANSSVGVGAGSPPGGGGMPPNLPVAEQPAFIADRQKKIATDEDAMVQQYQTRQVAKERLGELANLTETYQTGDLNAAKAKMQSLASAWGIPVPNTPTMNATAYEEFTKNAIANVFNDVKSIGGRVLVSEIQGLTKSNANAELQPEAAAKIIAQGAGILNYEDKHADAYFNWKHNGNQNAYDTSTFETPWLKANPVRDYTDSAMQQIAPLGASKPTSPSQLKVGQVYQSPNGHGIGRWDGKQFVPETRPAAERLFPKVTVTQ